MSANTNKSLKSGKIDSIGDIASIANNRSTTISDVLIALAKKQLEPVKNKGKTKFLAVVTKVLEGHTSDPFLNEEYDIDRVDGVTKQLQKNSKVVLLHIPALYTYYENQSVEIKNSTDLKQKIGTIDLYKISCVTTKNVQVNDIVNVEFEDPLNFKNPKITTPDNKDKLRLNIDVVKFLKAKKILKEQNACKLLNTEEAQGYAIKSKMFLNPGNPRVGYAQFYTNFSDIAKKDNILKQIVRNKSPADLAKIGLSASATSAQTYKELTTNSKYHFSSSLNGNTKVVDYINSNTSIKPSEKIIPITTNAEAQRELYLKIETPNINNDFKVYIVEYLKSVITSEFNYGWTDSNNKGYKIDIFGSNKIDDSLKKGDVSLAIEYSTKVDNVSRNSATSMTEKTVRTPLTTSKTPDQTKSDATKQDTAVNKPAAEAPVCDSIATVNNKLYIPAKAAKSFNQDTKRWKGLGIQLKNWFSIGLSLIIDGTFSESSSFLTLQKLNNSDFSYAKDVEIISGSPESIIKQHAVAIKKKELRKPPIQRGTNSVKVEKNLKQLTLFCKELTKLIAINENVSINQVYLMPISVWRKYHKAKKDDGQDKNSRHFFGRAIDFTVYINYDKNMKLESKTISTEGTYEIPNTIIYLYVLALLKLHKTKFGVCGIGLLRDGTKRKSGYVHYEYMRETSNENVGLLKNRRWVSQPKKKEKNTVYAKAFGQPDSNKDKIIKDFVFKDIKTKIGIIPEKLENLL